MHHAVRHYINTRGPNFRRGSVSVNLTKLNKHPFETLHNQSESVIHDSEEKGRDKFEGRSWVNGWSSDKYRIPTFPQVIKSFALSSSFSSNRVKRFDLVSRVSNKMHAIEVNINSEVKLCPASEMIGTLQNILAGLQPIILQYQSLCHWARPEYPCRCHRTPTAVGRSTTSDPRPGRCHKNPPPARGRTILLSL